MLIPANEVLEAVLEHILPSASDVTRPSVLKGTLEAHKREQPDREHCEDDGHTATPAPGREIMCGSARFRAYVKS